MNSCNPERMTEKRRALDDLYLLFRKEMSENFTKRFNFFQGEPVVGAALRLLRQ